MNARPPRVIVAGGGIGGLCLARALSRHGVEDVVVVEATPAWAPLGAGLILGANAVAVLDAVGLGDALRAVSYRLPALTITDASGRVLQHLDTADVERDAGPTLTVHRADLHAMLLGGAANVVVRLGAAVRRVERRAHDVRVTASDGAIEDADLLVGADGIHSRVREAAFGDGDARVRYAGYSCWRFVTENVAGVEGAFEMWGAGRRLGLVPLTAGRVYVFLTENGPADGRDPVDGRHGFVAAKFRGFGGPAAPVIARLAADTSIAILRHDIAELDRQVWVEGRVALLGDAAHATTPNLGQGAGMAIEDALALARCLSGTSASDVPTALTRYERMRASRVKAVVTQSRRLGALGQWSHPLATGAVAALMRLTPAAVNRAALLAVVRPGVALARGSSRS